MKRRCLATRSLHVVAWPLNSVDCGRTNEEGDERRRRMLSVTAILLRRPGRIPRHAAGASAHLHRGEVEVPLEPQLKRVEAERVHHVQYDDELEEHDEEVPPAGGGRRAGGGGAAQAGRRAGAAARGERAPPRKWEGARPAAAAAAHHCRALSMARPTSQLTVKFLCAFPEGRAQA